MADPLRELLELVRTGAIEVDAAAARLSGGTVAEMPFATVDLSRQARCGFPEVILAEGKTVDWLLEIVARIVGAGQDCLATRLNEAQTAALAAAHPTAEIDRLARTFWLRQSAVEPRGDVLIVTAGTGDLPVAQEALVAARALGSKVERIADVGVAGLHRLLRHRERLTQADVIVVVAGMDGALPSVVGGLVDCPVIAVPTSIGYGAAFGGTAALLTMLNSCAANVAVVNIDAGFKAGYIAAMIARR
jgi:NCAIR mutase (PurE)-related protein